MRLTMKIICAVARLEMKPAFNDIRELTSLCIASGCSPEKRDSIYFRLFNKLRQCWANTIHRQQSVTKLNVTVFSHLFSICCDRKLNKRRTHQRECERWRSCCWHSTDCKYIDPNPKISLVVWVDKMLWYLPFQLSPKLLLERCRNLSPVTNSRASLGYFQAS